MLATEGDRHGDVGRYGSRSAADFRRLTIDLSEDDLRGIAKHGYEGAASTDHDQRAQAVSLFITDMLAASIGQGCGVTTVATPFQ